MKKIIILLIIVFAIVVLYFGRNIERETPVSSDENVTEVLDEGEVVVVPPSIEYDNANRVFNGSSELECNDDPAICAVDLAVKCTINPKSSFCDKTKLPRFIFMDDKSLTRPTMIDYTIVKTHPIDIHTIEVQTKSDCDGGWFGLCKGNVIYVLNNSSGEWIVKEIYALETY